MNPKRRWTLAIVAAFLLFMLLVVGALMPEPKDAPRVTVLGSSYQNGNPVVSLGLHAPSGKAIRFYSADVFAVDGNEKLAGFFTETNPPTINAGNSATCHLTVLTTRVPPTNRVWRLLVTFWVENKGPSGWLRRFRNCISLRDLSQLRHGFVNPQVFRLYTDPFTNPVPPTADAPRP